ncbi:MAG: DUF4384 domain-containing protein [Candidatus Eisenbacteria bacterium]
MKTLGWPGILTLAGCLLVPTAASARALSVELWTDRGTDAVYQPGDPILIKARTSDDSYLLVYEIDAVGSVNLLFPAPGHGAGVEGRHTYRVPGSDQDELIVDATTGQGYIVAIASDTPFDELPWFLRPVNAQADGVGYFGEPDDEEGITKEGRIVGDPFVAMERIRRRVLRNAKDEDGFATAYASYFVHERVRYPRYLCNDCHRPGRYAFWENYDPYYTTCSVFDFRVNWSWGWGPRYWFGSVPYFVYVYRDDCPPSYRRYSNSGIWYSAWDGWNRWCDLWGSGGLRRYKSAPPPGYTPPDRYLGAGRTPRQLPPGFIASTVEKRGGIRQGVGFGVGDEQSGDERGNGRSREANRERRDNDSDRRRVTRPEEGGRQGIGDQRPTREGWSGQPRGARESRPVSEPPRFGRSREEHPTPGAEGSRAPERLRDVERAPQRPREEYRAPQRPREEQRAPERPREEHRAPDPPRREERAPERPKQEYRAPDPPKHEPHHVDPPRERSRGNEGSRPARGNEGGRKDR